jgi:hypothetical protein
MGVNLLQVVENLFETLERARLKELRRLIKRYNKEPDPLRAIREDLQRMEAKVREKRANVQEIYLTTTQPVCPCCRR